MLQTPKLLFSTVILALCGLPLLAAAQQEVTERPPYRIGVEDVLEVNVWKNPDVSRQVWVRPDGRISLPLAGEIFAEGLTTVEFTEVLTARLKDYFADPVVTVSLVELNSYTIYLLGWVRTPGAMKLRSPKTFLQVIAMAGGFEEFADTDSVVLVRWEKGKEKRIKVNAKRIIRKGLDSDFLLQPGDVILVP